MSKGAGIVQWYQTPVISGMNIGPGIQQDLHRLPPTIACTRAVFWSRPEPPFLAGAVKKEAAPAPALQIKLQL